MGWERKRGKLSEFNEFLALGDNSAFPVRAGEADSLIGTPYVITIDADTILPPGAAHRLLGAIAHPLNRAGFDPEGRLNEGYTFIQPRVEIAPVAGTQSWFTRLYTGDTAIDIYSRAVSDVYQDLFGEGIFTGKGAYDVAAFRQATKGRVPDNAVLSHDLFEGLHGRTALASDIVLYEDFPHDLLGYARRSHRWIRGDWQLLPWLGSRVPGADGAGLSSRFNLLDRWRIADNLRRSLIAPGLALLAVAGWLMLPGPAWLWTMLTIAAPGAYLFTDLVTNLARGRRRGSVRSRLKGQLDHAGRWAIAIVFMLYDAAVAMDAIGRSLWRMYFSHKQMLEWTTAAQIAHSGDRGALRYWREMWIAPALAMVLAMLVLAIDPVALTGAAPLLALWFLSPAIAARIGRPIAARSENLDIDDQVFLRKLARRTWYFFEVFAGPEDNWLPPDNYQFDPRPETAHRTSPTNIGMFLLSALAARDFGYLGLRDMATRSRAVLDTMDRMDRHRGHWLNWYDTRSLRPLEPRYVSTVDSGNLAVSLVTLAEGLGEFSDGPVLQQALWSGLSDTLDLLSDALSDSPGPVSDRRRIGEDHDHIIQRDLHQRVIRVALGELRPDKHHRRAGRGAQQDHARDILARRARLDEGREDIFEEQHAESCHGEGLDQPVHGQCDDQPLGAFMNALERCEIHPHHHRIDHEPDQHRDHEIDRAIFKACKKVDYRGGDLAKRQSSKDCQGDPDGKVAFKNRHVWCPSRFREMLFGRWLNIVLLVAAYGLRALLLAQGCAVRFGWSAKAQQVAPCCDSALAGVRQQPTGFRSGAARAAATLRLVMGRVPLACGPWGYSNQAPLHGPPPGLRSGQRARAGVPERRGPANSRSVDVRSYR